MPRTLGYPLLKVAAFPPRLPGSLENCLLATDLVPQQDYALRAKPADRECPLARVRFVGPARAGKAKVRYRDGELEGLDEWTPTRGLMCPWPERHRFLRDEARFAALQQAAAADRDPVIEEAISTVFEATGDDSGFTRVWSTDPERARRLWRRAELPGEPDHHPLAYTDRHGMMHMPWETALQFAQAFAVAELESCIHYLQEREERLRAEGYQPGERHSHSFLRGLRPAFAVVREWCRSGELGLLQEENTRLRRLLYEAISALRQAGLDRQASRLDRALQGR